MMKLPRPRRWNAGWTTILSNTAVPPTTKTLPLAATLVTGADHRVVDAVQFGRDQVQVVIGEPGIFGVLGFHVHDHHGLRCGGDVQPVLLGQLRIAENVVGQDSQYPRRSFCGLG